ncbi:MAG: sensor histidine kinase, partial [Ilumatobacteraceae bacterium]
IEAAIYFCCLEALRNAARHAPAATARVSLAGTAGSVCFEVTDDGPGFDPACAAGEGHGFVNMRDRMGSFGGRIDVVSAVGAGTTIRGHVPLEN